MLLMLSVFAAPVEKGVTAVYNNIKIRINGEELVSKDGNGKTVEPFQVDGTTYLPVRAISEAFGMNVGWDSNTNTVILDGTPKLSASGNAKVFEESFTSPMSHNWKTLDGNYIFDGQNGINFLGRQGQIELIDILPDIPKSTTKLSTKTAIRLNAFSNASKISAVLPPVTTNYLPLTFLLSILPPFLSLFLNLLILFKYTL